MEDVGAGPSTSDAKDSAHPLTLYTVGHSTRSLDQLVDLLREHGIRTLVDIRTVPRSRTNSQFNKETLEANLLRSHGIAYRWMGKELGGLRHEDTSSRVNAAWENKSFKGYADYALTPAFREGVEALLRTACSAGPVALMCAEVVHFKCHRSLLSDALVARGCQVLHLTAAHRPAAPHRLTKFIKLDPQDPTHITYPPYAKAALGKEHAAAEEDVEAGAGHSHKRQQQQEQPKQPRIDTFFQPKAKKKKSL